MVAGTTHWERVLFRLRIYEVKTDGFQALINDILSKTEPGFTTVRAWLGDEGNDGWNPSSGHYFQVFGPWASSKANPVKTAAKAKRDFGKLNDTWAGLRHYTFVMNDRYEGIPAPVHRSIQSIRDSFSVEADVLGAHALETRFCETGEDDRALLVGGRPARFVAGQYDPSALGSVLRSLADSGPHMKSLNLKAPDFAAKIAFNGLAAVIADELKHASYHIGAVERLLAVERGFAEDVAQAVHQLYHESCQIVPDREPDASSIRYLWIKQQVVPSSAFEHAHTATAYDHAAALVLAKYFESCDIYESPNISSA